MSSHRKSIVLATAVMLASSAFAYDYPLSSDSIREAYFVGKRGGKSTADFLDQYTHHFPVPRSGPNVAMIQLETPFARIVEHAEQTLNYNAPDAVREFEQHPPEFRLRVQIYFTPSYTAIAKSAHGETTLRRDDFWRDFKIELIQGTEVHPDRIAGHALWGGGNGRGPARRIGAEIQLYFPATEIRSGPAAVEVLGPEGNQTRASFDLATLR